MADVSDSLLHPAGVGYARDRDPLAAERHALLRAVEVHDRYLHLAAGFALEHSRHLLGREPFGRLTVDREDQVSDLQPGPVRRGPGIGLRDLHPVALFADQGADAPVFARREQFEVREPLLGDVLRVGVEVADHAFCGTFHQPVGVDRIDVSEREFAHHVHRDLHVAAQPEVVLAGMDRAPCDGQQGGCGDQKAVFAFSCHIVSCVCTNPAGIRPGPHRGGCRR